MMSLLTLYFAIFIMLCNGNYSELGRIRVGGGEKNLKKNLRFVIFQNGKRAIYF